MHGVADVADEADVADGAAVNEHGVADVAAEADVANGAAVNAATDAVERQCSSHVLGPILRHTSSR